MFFKIKPGLWGLNTYHKKLEHLTLDKVTPAKKEELNHSYYQGLLLQIGNIGKYQTFVPHQDKNKGFLNTTLGDTRKLQLCHPFSYKNTVKRASMVDVIWFNRRDMPYAAFEVEHTTDFTAALSKYIALQDFNTKFYIISNQTREQEFNERIQRDEYHPIKSRVKFMDYEKLATWHGRNMQISCLGELP